MQSIDGLDVAGAVAMMGGLTNAYEKTVRLSTRLLPGTIDKMSKYLMQRNVTDFTTEIHGLKTVMRSIGATRLGAEAARLETAGKANDVNYCVAHFPAFKEMALDLEKKINAVIATETSIKKGKISKDALAAAVAGAKTAAQGYDAKGALDALKNVKDYTYTEKADGVLVQLIHSLEEFNCAKALEIIKQLEGLL